MTTATFESTTSIAITSNGWWVGYITECEPKTWRLVLLSDCGAPRNVTEFYPTKDLAIARARQELGLP